MSNTNIENEENSSISKDEHESKIKLDEYDFLNIIISILYLLSAFVTTAFFKYDVKENFSSFILSSLTIICTASGTLISSSKYNQKCGDVVAIRFCSITIYCLSAIILIVSFGLVANILSIDSSSNIVFSADNNFSVFNKIFNTLSYLDVIGFLLIYLFICVLQIVSSIFSIHLKRHKFQKKQQGES